MKPSQLVSKEELWGILKGVKEELANNQRLMKQSEFDERLCTEVKSVSDIKFQLLSSSRRGLLHTYKELFSYFQDY